MKPELGNVIANIGNMIADDDPNKPQTLSQKGELVVWIQHTSTLGLFEGAQVIVDFMPSGGN